MTKEQAQKRLEELRRTRAGLTALLDFARLEGMISAFEEMAEGDSSED